MDPNHSNDASAARQTNSPDNNQNPVAEIAEIEALSSGHVIVRPKKAPLIDNNEGTEVATLLEDLKGHAVILDAASHFVPDRVRGVMISLQSHSDKDCCIIANSPETLASMHIQRLETALPIENSLQDALRRLDISSATGDSAAGQEVFAHLKEVEERRKEEKARNTTTDSGTLPGHKNLETKISVIDVPDSDSTLITAAGRIESKVEERPLLEILLEASKERTSVVLDISDSKGLSAEGVGALIAAHKTMQASGKELIILDESENQAQCRLLKQMGLNNFLTITDDMSSLFN